jgi:hypothetical protein
MAVDAIKLKLMIDTELTQLTDSRVIAHIRALLVEPEVVDRQWDYGREGEQYPCWTVLKHQQSNTGIAYCEHGFGPRSPWGLVFLEGLTSIGMDSGWFTSFVQAYFESSAATDLPIWRVFKSTGAGSVPISEEGEWNDIWKKVMALRESDPANRYDCDTGVQYERQH